MVGYLSKSKHVKYLMELQVGVKALLRNPEGKYLLLERNIQKYPDVTKNQRWDLVGGRIEPGSLLLENLEREIYEETGLKLHGKPKVIYAQDILTGSGRHIVRITYLAETLGGEVILDDDHEAYKWLSMEEIDELKGLDGYFKQLIDSGVLEDLN